MALIFNPYIQCQGLNSIFRPCATILRPDLERTSRLEGEGNMAEDVCDHEDRDMINTQSSSIATFSLHKSGAGRVDSRYDFTCVFTCVEWQM